MSLPPSIPPPCNPLYLYPPLVPPSIPLCWILCWAENTRIDQLHHYSSLPLSLPPLSPSLPFSLPASPSLSAPSLCCLLSHCLPPSLHHLYSILLLCITTTHSTRRSWSRYARLCGEFSRTIKMETPVCRSVSHFYCSRHKDMYWYL